jgi:hypothetical protein
MDCWGLATAGDLLVHDARRRLLVEVRRAIPAGLPLVAETDADAVGFYVATGFTATSLREKYPGVQRFHVRLDTDACQDRT